MKQLSECSTSNILKITTQNSTFTDKKNKKIDLPTRAKEEQIRKKKREKKKERSNSDEERERAEKEKPVTCESWGRGEKNLIFKSGVMWYLSNFESKRKKIQINKKS